MRILGMISGTSHDGIDVAVVDFTDAPAARWPAASSTARRRPYEPGAARPARRGAAAGAGRLRRRLRAGHRHRAGLRRAPRRALAAHAAPAGAGPVDAICSHGQTVFHWVDGGARAAAPCSSASPPGSPRPPACRWSPTCARPTSPPAARAPRSCRSWTAAAAPAVPRQRAAALNLGGIANLTVCAPAPIRVAWDTGPGNALIDAVVAASAATPATYDRDGAWPPRAQVHPGPARPSCWPSRTTRCRAPKSTGKELFHRGYVDALARRAAVAGPARPRGHADRADRGHRRRRGAAPPAGQRGAPPAAACTTPC